MQHANDSIQESLWFNKHTDIDNKVVFIDHLYNCEIKYISDILKQDGRLLTYKDVCKQYECEMQPIVPHWCYTTKLEIRDKRTGCHPQTLMKSQYILCWLKPVNV